MSLPWRRVNSHSWKVKVGSDIFGEGEGCLCV